METGYTIRLVFLTDDCPHNWVVMLRSGLVWLLAPPQFLTLADFVRLAHLFVFLAYLNWKLSVINYI